MKQTARPQGFSVVEVILVVAVVGIIGFIGFKVYDMRQTDDTQKRQSTSNTQSDTGREDAQAVSTPTTTEASTVTAPPASPSTTPTTTPKPAPAPTPKAWDIVHPNTDTCLNGQDKTVYVSESNGAYVYNSDFSATSAKIDYKTAKTGKCVYLSNGTGWIRYGTETQLRWQDVSITAP